MRDSSGKIVVHGGRAHVDDFLASCVCLHKTGLELFRTSCTQDMLEDPYCWVLDHGMRFEPELLNFDHHHLDMQICSLTMLLDHLYGRSYREHMPQFEYIEIHDSRGASRAAKFAGIGYEKLEVSSSMIQHLILKSFSSIEGKVEDPIRSVMSQMGSELCRRIEFLPSLIEQLDLNAKFFEFSGLKILDVTGCASQEPDSLPTKSWCRQRGISPSIILTKDSRVPGSYRMISLDRSLRFSPNPLSTFTHPSGFMTVFEEFENWSSIISA